MDAKVHQNEANGFVKLSWIERIGFGGGDFAQNLIFGTVGSQLLFYLTTVYGLSAAAGTLIFFIVRWINVFWDPFVGAYVDKHHPKWGKYRSYLITMALPMTVLAALLFYPNEAVRGNFWFAMIVYLVLELIYSFVNIPYGALNSSLTRDVSEVSKLTTTRMTMANIGNLLVYTFLPFFVQMAAPNPELKDTGFFGVKLMLGDWTAHNAGSAWFKVMSIYMVLGFLFMLGAFFTTKERVLPDEEATEAVKYSDLWHEFLHNRPLRVLGFFFLIGFTFMFFGNTANNYFLQYNLNHASWTATLGLIGSIPGIALMPFVPWLHRKIGKLNVFYTALGAYILGLLFLFAWNAVPALHDSLPWALVGTFLRSAGMGIATGYMWALVPEVVAYGEWQSGKRVAAIINALLGLMFKIGLALGGIIPGWILTATKFDGTAATQNNSALQGIIWSFVWFPIALAVLAMWIMSKYELSDTKVEQINLELAQRQTEKGV
ncbi:MAG TPA: MFS transporter [Lactobacillaceae bacterium]|jgi:GPH family glycoside/pentoside/hexuronide:cation symporter